MSGERIKDDDVSTKRAQPPTPPASNDSETVTVACKMPNGLLLQLCADEKGFEPLMGGGFREVTRSRRLPETVYIKGSSVNIEDLRKGNMPEYYIISGYALTPGVPKKFWEQWLAQNKESDVIKNKILFAADGEINVRAQAKEYANIQSGLEPINPENPTSKSRELRGIQRSVVG